MRSGQLQDALNNLSHAIRETESVLEEMRAEHDPLALYIFLARRSYRNVRDGKSGKRSEREALSGWQKACDLGFRGDLDEWERLMGAASRR